MGVWMPFGGVRALSSVALPPSKAAVEQRPFKFHAEHLARASASKPRRGPPSPFLISFFFWTWMEGEKRFACSSTVVFGGGGTPAKTGRHAACS